MMHIGRIFLLVALLNALISPVTEGMGIELYDMEFVKEGGVKILRLYIDKEGGVSLNDCENVSRAIEAVLDEHDPIPSSYRLQVGSPGVERKLAKPEHYIKNIGSKVTAKLFTPHKINESTSQKVFTGVLAGYDKEKITIEDSGGNKFCFLTSQVASCRISVFDEHKEKPKSKKGRALSNG